MKTINFILVITLFSFFTTNAQITKGNWMVGGNGSFSNLESYNNNYKNDKRKTSELDIKANVGYFFIDKLQAGAKISYLLKKIPQDNLSWLKYELYSRYYILKPEKIVNIYLEAGYFFGNHLFNNINTPQGIAAIAKNTHMTKLNNRIIIYCIISYKFIIVY